jgi:hypothetical protein
MTGRTHAIIVAVLFALLAWSTGSNRAAAQPSNCCKYTIDVAGISEECLPITIVSDWGPGGQDTVQVTSNTVLTPSVPGPCPSYLLNWISVNGGMPISAVGERNVTIGDCCYKFIFVLSPPPDLCTTIYIRPCDPLR